MARLHLALLLLFVTVSAVVVSAADRPPSITTAEAPGASASGGDVDVAEGPADDNAIGTTDDDAAATPGDDDVVVPGPIGSETSYANYSPPQQASESRSSALAIGFASVGAATAASLFFF